ncbi:MAG: Zn-dependent alcohol dehydrogenase [Hyphomicrobiales bacterium]
MKAAVCRKFGGPLEIESVGLASPSEGEVKVKMAACAICHSDIIALDGGWGGELPAVFGHEAAGIVEAVGPGVTHLKPGDHAVVTLIRSCGRCHYCAQGKTVVCETSFPIDENSPLTDSDGKTITHGLRTGAFAEYVTVHGSQAVAIDKSVPLDSASLLGCGVITGLGSVWNTANVPAGATVVVIGCGGVGLNAVQGAALAGAKTIIGLDLAEDKLEAALAFGATHAFHAGDNEGPDKVRAVTDGRGADFVFVTVGAKIAVDRSHDYLAPAGAVVIVGMPDSGVMGEFEPAEFAFNSHKIIGSCMGSTKVATDIPRLVDFYMQGRLKLDELITGRFSLEEINEAIGSVRRGEALRNVVVFEIS